MRYNANSSFERTAGGMEGKGAVNVFRRSIEKEA